MPPDAVTVAVPLLPPLQLTLVCDVVAVIAVGWVIVTLRTTVQLLASRTVTVYVPAVNPLIEAVVWPELHAYVNVPVPPDAVTVAVPLLPPLQLTFVCDVVAVIAVGSVIVTLRTTVQLFASRTVTV
mgnify:CR=1 FL=1